VAFAPVGLLHVLASTSPRPSGRKHHISQHLSALATKAGEIFGLTLALTAIFSGGPAAAAQRDLATTERFPSAESKHLEVDAANLDVRLRTADVDSIEAEVLLHIGGTGEEKAQRWIENHTPEFTDSEDRLKVVVDPGKSGFLGFGSLSARARLSLLAPAEIVPDITTTSGSILIHGDFPNAGPLHLRTSTGSVEMIGAAASVDFRSSAGDARIEVIRPLDSIMARTASGDVNLTGGARVARVDTASGRIWLQNLSGDVNVSSSTAKITLSWDRLEPGATVRIRSSSGRVQLIIPEGVHPQGTLTTTTGSVRSEFPGEVVEGGMTLRLSGDGPTFDVETASGEIQLIVGEVWQ
jgi:DUF4097 and DUF4098 domain-containing protein YvlB